MSNIPQARIQLAEAKRLIGEAQELITDALAQLDRRKPDFRSVPLIPKLTPAQKARCRRLRKKGLSIYQIAQIVRTNHGRVSEAIAGKAH